jgi:hypothetical protein
MNRNWSFYDAKTGLLRAKRVTIPHYVDVSTKTPEGCKPIEGFFDHLSQRIDIRTGDVVDYVPPQPDADYEWSMHHRRWLKNEDVRTREFYRQEVQARVEALELRSLRAQRELRANPQDEEALARLAAIDTEIEGLVPALREQQWKRGLT